MTSTLSPEAFMAQPVDPDEDVYEEPTPAWATATLEVSKMPGLLEMGATLARIEAKLNEQEVADSLREQHDDLLAEHLVLRALVEEIETIIKPSTSKLANQVRAAIKAWRAPEVPRSEDPHHDEPADLVPLPHPAHDAGIELWRAYATRMGVEGAESMNRSQIRTVLGIEQPS